MADVTTLIEMSKQFPSGVLLKKPQLVQSIPGVIPRNRDDKIPTMKTTNTSCRHRRQRIGEVKCPTCKGHIRVMVFACALHGQCTISKRIEDTMVCCPKDGTPGCLDREPLTEAEEEERKELNKPAKESEGEVKRAIVWQYGMTTVPERIESGLTGKTLDSLIAAGFPNPRLFVDGVQSYEYRGLEITPRYPRVRTYANWYLSMLELYLRNPEAHRYAIFQDDFVTYRNLRLFLEKSEMPEKSYLNLYSFPSNESRVPKDYAMKPRHCWYPGLELNGDPNTQAGRGAVALVFDREGVQTLLRSQHMVERVRNIHRRHKSTDGAIVTAMNLAGWKEYVFYPSLTQHTGEHSSMGNKPHKQATSFRGESFDALELLA